jgi:hypothetical protein
VKRVAIVVTDAQIVAIPRFGRPDRRVRTSEQLLRDITLLLSLVPADPDTVVRVEGVYEAADRVRAALEMT